MQCTNPEGNIPSSTSLLQVCYYGYIGAAANVQTVQAMSNSHSTMVNDKKVITTICGLDETCLEILQK